MRRTRVMNTWVDKTQLAGAVYKFSRQPTGIRRPIEAEISTEGGRRRKDKLKEWRAVATSYEKTKPSFIGALRFAVKADWLK